MEFVGAVAARDEMLGQFVDHHLGRAENDRELHILEIDQPAEHLELRAAIDFVINLLDRRHRHRLRLDAHVHRIAREVLDQLLDRPRNRGGEEDGLPFVRHLAQDRLDVVDEAHVEHAVGFIEDHHLDLIELQTFALEVIHDAARRADDDLRAGAAGRGIAARRIGRRRSAIRARRA